MKALCLYAEYRNYQVPDPQNPKQNVTREQGTLTYCKLNSTPGQSGAGHPAKTVECHPRLAAEIRDAIAKAGPFIYDLETGSRESFKKGVGKIDLLTVDAGEPIEPFANHYRMSHEGIIRIRPEPQTPPPATQTTAATGRPVPVRA